MNRLRQTLESIVFAGLKPHDPRNPGPPPADTWFLRLRAKIDRFITGGPQADPLYLTNRTWGQKIRAWSLVTVPLLILGTGIVMTLTHTFGPPPSKPAPSLSTAEVAARELPSLNDVRVESNRSLEVVEASIDRKGAAKVVGLVKNKTARDIPRAEVNCELTDAMGSTVGALTVLLEGIPASGTKRFEAPLKVADAEIVLVRDIVTH